MSGKGSGMTSPLAVLSLALVWLMLVIHGATARDVSSDLAPAANGLNKMTSDVCHSLKMKCKKSLHSRAHPVARPAAKAAKARHKESAKAQPSSSIIPIPLAKPQLAAVPDVQTTKNNPVAPIPRIRPHVEPTQPSSVKTAVEVPAVPPVRDVPVLEKPEARTASIEPDGTQIRDAGDCESSLRNSKVRFDAVPASFGNVKCPINDPVRLHSIETPSGIVSFPEAPVFNCRFARQFALWVSDTGSAVVLAQMNKRLERVATGPGYDCRHRNGDSSGKMSEHAAGDAVDITTMTLAGGTTIQMADAIDPASPSYAVLRALRTTACGYFTTVLGPGANEAHREHYHLDLGVHGKSGNYRICE